MLPHCEVKFRSYLGSSCVEAAVVLSLHKYAAEYHCCAQGAEHRYPTEVEEGPRAFTATGGVVKLGRLHRVAQGGRHSVYKHVQIIDLKCVGRQ